MCLPRQGSWGVAALKHIASCSFGKDSLATILLALEHGEPLDEAVYCEVMFDKTISGEVPEHRDFIYNTALPRLEQMGVPIRVLRSDKTYVDLFTGQVTRGPKKGKLRSFPICGKCYVQRDCKIRPIRQYQKTLPPDTVHYIGIARDEQERLLRLTGPQVSLLEKYLYTEDDAKQLCRKAGRLSMSLPIAVAAGSVPMPRRRNCDTSMTTIQISGQECWSCRRSPERCLRNSTVRKPFRTLMPGSAQRARRRMPSKWQRKGEMKNEQFKI